MLAITMVLGKILEADGGRTVPETYAELVTTLEEDTYAIVLGIFVVPVITSVAVGGRTVLAIGEELVIILAGDGERDKGLNHCK
jgi:hypothetical protein